MGIIAAAYAAGVFACLHYVFGVSGWKAVVSGVLVSGVVSGALFLFPRSES